MRFKLIMLVLAAFNFAMFKISPADIETGVMAVGSDILNEQLIKAAGEGNLAEVIDLLSKDADVNAVDGKNKTPIICAAAYGRTEVVKALLAAKSDINTVDRHDCTPLILTVINGHAETVNALLDADADVNVVAETGMTALMLAARPSRSELKSSPMPGICRRMYASRPDPLDIIQALLDKGADIPTVHFVPDRDDIRELIERYRPVFNGNRLVKFAGKKYKSVTSGAKRDHHEQDKNEGRGAGGGSE